MRNAPVVHQFTAVLNERDATGHHTLALDQILRELGATTSIFVAHVNPRLKNQAIHYERHPHHPKADLIIYQASTGSPVADYLANRSEPLVVNYHNMTPASYFLPWSPHLSADLDYGRRQLARLCRQASFGIADSHFNAVELASFGLRRVEVAPVLIDGAALPIGGASSDRALATKSSGAEGMEIGGVKGMEASGAKGKETSGVKGMEARVAGTKTTLLFVGRLAPNKCQHDLVSALAVLRRWGCDAELVLVGSSSADSYLAALKDFAASLGVDDSVKFAGSVSTRELAKWYQCADAFVCLSEHEGFCVPLVEAMAWGVPVVAAAAAAVPETIDGAGLLLTDKSPVVVASAVQKVLTDAKLREELVCRGLQRAAQLGPEAAKERMRQVLTPLLELNEQGREA